MLGQAVSKAISSNQGYNLAVALICWYYEVFENPSFSALTMAAAAAAAADTHDVWMQAIVQSSAYSSNVVLLFCLSPSWQHEPQQPPTNDSAVNSPVQQ